MAAAAAGRGGGGEAAAFLPALVPEVELALGGLMRLAGAPPPALLLLLLLLLLLPSPALEAGRKSPSLALAGSAGT